MIDITNTFKIVSWHMHVQTLFDADWYMVQGYRVEMYTYCDSTDTWHIAGEVASVDWETNSVSLVDGTIMQSVPNLSLDYTYCVLESYEQHRTQLPISV